MKMEWSSLTQDYSDIDDNLVIEFIWNQMIDNITPILGNTQVFQLI